MKESGNHTDFRQEKEEANGLAIHSIKDILDGTLLIREAVVKQLPFVLFLTFLAILYIGSRYHAERLVRKTDQLQKELKELRAEAIYVASEYNRLNKQSEVIRLVERAELGLKESLEPPKKLSRKK